ncbi:MAG: amidohydrolase family protein, partial [Thermomicrobiales bacterium]
MREELLITNVRPLHGAATDLRIVDGLIDEMARGLHPSPGATVIDGGGRLLFPGFVDAHAHMDKTLIGLGWYRNEVGPT